MWFPSRVSIVFIIIILQDINTFIQQRFIKMIKNDIYNATKNYILNKGSSFEISIHQRILVKMFHGFSKQISTLKIIRNVF